MNLPNENLLPNRGWVCPLCNSVMSPTCPTCWYCRPVSKNIFTSEIGTGNEQLQAPIDERMYQQSIGDKK